MKYFRQYTFFDSFSSIFDFVIQCSTTDPAQDIEVHKFESNALIKDAVLAYPFNILNLWSVIVIRGIY